MGGWAMDGGCAYLLDKAEGHNGTKLIYHRTAAERHFFCQNMFVMKRK